jgi:BirA family transcriptional regulator, biotin operon repressor / biotin---[acetyl-CoA-carboxylase] ligase
LESGFLIMNENILQKTLSNVPLGGFRYYEQTGSTNDIALAWAAAGAPDLALVVAEEQTAGRGRGNRSWFTPAGAGLAFSLVLQPSHGEQQSIPLFSALAALAVCEAVEPLGLEPEIKWPNDVLLNRRKVCGILAESVWLGEKLESIVLGVGVNIKQEAVPPPAGLNFPATCLEAELDLSPRILQTVDRPALLCQILQSMLHWRGLLPTTPFLHALEERLAFRGELVEIWADSQVIGSGQVDGLGQDGSLRLLSTEGQAMLVRFGEVHLRPVG